MSHILPAPEQARRAPLQALSWSVAAPRRAARERVGRQPWLTLGLFVLTAFVVTWQTLWPPLIGHLQWDAARVGQGELWRLVTGLLVHTNGESQILVNLSTLLVLGAFVELRWSRTIWLSAFLAGAFSAEAAGVYWYPVGGGNSVGLWGLLGLTLVGLMANHQARWPLRWGLPLLGFSIGALFCYFSDIHGPPVFAGALVGIIALHHARARGQEPLRIGG